ncbi:40225_t:CDS:1 [Gigaspora margarita]|uniref:40225_t:CDS:1 n=1 Tax=Gigaspora margarita TaxID=4874 RepID=A0ABN7VDC5_GIGMA|nr:40225_t:CDS:1 [Gigaspora margarita]
MVSISQDLSIPESCLLDINQVNIAENSNKQSSVFPMHKIDEDILHQNSIITSDKRVKNRKLRSKSIQISDSSSIIGGTDMTRPFRSKSTIHKSTKKADNGELYTLIERNRKETEEAERESERILNSS